MANASKLIDNMFNTSPFATFLKDQQRDDFDEFCDWVHEVRVKAGVEEPKIEDFSYGKFMGGKYVNMDGQVVFKGKITIPAPNFHGMVYGITGDSDDDKK